MSVSRPVTPRGADDPDGPGRRSDDQELPAGPDARPPSAARRRAVFAAVVVLAAVVLFFLYVRLSQTFQLNSDDASNAMQAWAIMHGNPLLRGWTLSDVSFYTTELPEYMLVELVYGLGGEVAHVSAALTYTLLVVLVALLAKGQATGKRAALRMLVGGGLLLSPQLGAGVQILLAQPDHTGTNVPVLLAWLLVDRGGRRWWVAPSAAVLLAAAYVADEAALVVGIVPLLAVAGWRLYQRAYQRRPAETELMSALAGARYELGLTGAGLIALAAGLVVPAMIRHAGGYQLFGVPDMIAPSDSMVAHVWSAADGLLTLFGANFFGLTLSLATGLVVVHLIGAVLAVWAICAGVRRFTGDDVVSSMLTAGALMALVAFMLYPKLAAPREMAAVLPFSAALAGRLLAERLAAMRLEPVLAAVLCLYVLTLGVNVDSPRQYTVYQQLASWLADRGLHEGLSTYTYAPTVTLDSGNRVQVCPMEAPPGSQELYPRMWEADRSCYNPSRYDANFYIRASAGPGSTSLTSVLHTFGRPARQYQVDGLTVMVWNYNLNTRTHWGKPWPVFDPSL
jgi:hypothetical protein